MRYQFREFSFESDRQWYRIITADIKEPYTVDRSGITFIYYPNTEGVNSRPSTRFQDITLNYSGAIYRLASIDPVSLVICSITDLEESPIIKRDWNYSYLLAKEIDFNLIDSLLTSDGKFDKITEGTEFNYYELINLTVNKPTVISDLNLVTTPITLINTKERYLINQTRTLATLYTEFEEILKPFNFEFKYEYETIDVTNREIATVQFEEYNKDYFRLLPNWEDEITSYKVPMKLSLYTTSIGKFERLFNEFNTLKFLSNFVRFWVKDSIGRRWMCNLKWTVDPETTQPNDVKNIKGSVGYYLGFPFTLEFYVVRNNKYYIINEIIKTLHHYEQNQAWNSSN